MDRLTAMRVFTEVAERGSLTAAAQRLDMSRAMVSRYLAELEAWLGTRLLHRTTRAVSLTDAGNDALPRCREMLGIADDLAGASHADSTPRGLLRVACSTSLGQAFLASAVTRFIVRHPGVAIDLVVADRTVDLVDERIDLAIRVTNEPSPGLIARRLATCHSVICAAPSYLQRHGTPERAEDLALHNCLTYTYFGKSLWQFTYNGTPLGVPVGGNLSANEVNVVFAATLAGAGISMQPVYAVLPHLRDGTLKALLPDYVPREMTVYGVYMSRKQMPSALRALLDDLIEQFRTGLFEDTGYPGRQAAPSA
ncbi:HTH-type transcriptional regulator DmlR [Pandoraea horticolens]|uniref:HTH-type transcriptional regulator DmlR n=1 Tax=Pandoraea horticolens TaxID=2508298 RepID=A0A5E4RKR2_9BURK|nr:LysR family transcriptional regulator [Pandoraea horticolens]VVD63907.1 HTH-type transcriptional regulator DmlR [Pandoraea horticolens]